MGKKLRFKVGDRVKIVGVGNDGTVSYASAAKYIGMVTTITDVSKRGVTYPYSVEGDTGYTWQDGELELVIVNNIVGGKLL